MKGTTGTVMISVFIGLMVLGFIMLPTQPASAQTLTGDVEVLQQYVNESRQVSMNYRVTLHLIAADYSPCFLIDEAGLSELDTRLTRAQASIFRNRLAEAHDILQQWYEAFGIYDQEKVAKPIDQCDQIWVKGDGQKYLQDIDAWLQDVQQNYDLGSLSQEWSGESTGQLALRSRFQQIMSSKARAPWGDYHAVLSAWFNDLAHFFALVEAKTLASDKDQADYQAWVKALGEYGALLRAYVDAEKADIYNAYKDELVGAKADYELFTTKESVLNSGEQAYTAANYAEADTRFAQVDRELVKPWAESGKPVRKHFEEANTRYNEDLNGLKTRIETLRQQGQKTAALAEAYAEATTAYSEAASAAARGCRDWFACATNTGESNLDEYDIYWATTRYGHVAAYIQWIDAAATDLEKTGASTLEVPVIDIAPDSKTETTPSENSDESPSGLQVAP